MQRWCAAQAWAACRQGLTQALFTAPQAAAGAGPEESAALRARLEEAQMALQPALDRAAAAERALVQETQHLDAQERELEVGGRAPSFSSTFNCLHLQMG